MNSRDNKLWLQLWRDKEIDFHQEYVNKFLAKFWPALDKTKHNRVFVPLCGKSLDMIWLANQGYKVIGVELSPIAVKAFFKENRLKPTKKRKGNFTLWKHGNVSILCGDYFSLCKEDLGIITTVYDRAALTALPEDIRQPYVEHLQLIVPNNANIFLLTIEDQDELPTSADNVDKEINKLYSDNYTIELAYAETVLESNSQTLTQIPTSYKVYRLSSRV